MLSFAPDFWPLFWTVLGGGALVTAVLSLLAATFSPAWFRPGNSNRARKQMYWELARLRQAMNQVEHIEPTGEENSRPSTESGRVRFSNSIVPAAGRHLSGKTHAEPLFTR